METNFGLLDNQIFTVQHPTVSKMFTIMMIIFQKKSLPLLKLNQTFFSIPVKQNLTDIAHFILTVSEREVLIYSSKSYLFARGKRTLKSWMSIKSIPLPISA